MLRWENQKFFFTPPVIDDMALSKLAEELEIFYTYALYTPGNNNVYIGLSRRDPDIKLSDMVARVRSTPGFQGLCGCDILVLNSELNQVRAAEDEKRLIRKMRESTKYKVINKSNGGTVGYSLKTAISNAALKKYFPCLDLEMDEQYFWSFGLWEMDPRPERLTKEQLPMPPKYFRTITECIEDVVQEHRAEHLRYVASNRSGTFSHRQDELLDWLDCI